MRLYIVSTKASNGQFFSSEPNKDPYKAYKALQEMIRAHEEETHQKVGFKNIQVEWFERTAVVKGIDPIEFFEREMKMEIIENLVKEIPPEE